MEIKATLTALFDVGRRQCLERVSGSSEQALAIKTESINRSGIRRLSIQE